MTDFRLGSLVAEVAGDGPAVVMVHGLGGSSNSFQPLMPGLAGFRVIRPDLPGAARSALRPGRPGLMALCQARSEEHTSELPSLMRTSYSVLCLKKKKTTTQTHYNW